MMMMMHYPCQTHYQNLKVVIKYVLKHMTTDIKYEHFNIILLFIAASFYPKLFGGAQNIL